MVVPTRRDIEIGDRLRNKKDPSIIARVTAKGVDENEQTLVRLAIESHPMGYDRTGGRRWYVVDRLFERYEGIDQ